MTPLICSNKKKPSFIKKLKRICLANTACKNSPRNLAKNKIKFDFLVKKTPLFKD